MRCHESAFPEIFFAVPGIAFSCRQSSGARTDRMPAGSPAHIARKRNTAEMKCFSFIAWLAKACADGRSAAARETWRRRRAAPASRPARKFFRGSVDSKKNRD